MATVGRYQQSFNSFSGVDMQVMAGGYLLAEIQGLSFTVTREKAPLYTMGSADPRSFSRGKRGIAGSMIFLVLDRSALLQSMKDSALYLANEYELVDTQGVEQTARGEKVRLFDEGTDTEASVGTVLAADPRTQRFNMGQKVVANVRYHDQILPFDIVLEAANEYGHMARMQICNTEIMNCGSGMSIDDINTDESCTWVATGIVPWYQQAFVNPRNGLTADATRARVGDRPRAGTVT